MKLCGFEVGLQQPFFLIAGPCVIESQQMALDTAARLKEICHELAIPFIYKSSYDKANRSSGKSFRGFGLDEGLKILGEVKKQIGVPVLTDVHTEDEVAPVAAVVDVLQTRTHNDDNFLGIRRARHNQTNDIAAQLTLRTCPSSPGQSAAQQDSIYSPFPCPGNRHRDSVPCRQSGACPASAPSPCAGQPAHHQSSHAYHRMSAPRPSGPRGWCESRQRNA